MPNLLPVPSQTASTSGSPKTRPKVPAAYTQAKALQALIMEDAGVYLVRRDTTDEQGRPLARSSDLAMLSRAWCDLEDTKRKLKMRPLPKPVDVEKHKAQRKAKASSGPMFTE